MAILFSILQCEFDAITFIWNWHYQFCYVFVILWWVILCKWRADGIQCLRQGPFDLFLSHSCWCDRFCSCAFYRSTAFLRPANLMVGSDIMRSFSSFSRILLSRAMRLCSFPLFFSCDKWSCFTFHSDHFLRGRDPFYFADSSWTRTPTCQRGEVL